MKRLILISTIIIIGLSLPYLWTFSSLEEGEVLAPVVDQSRLCGDFRYYFPLVNELKEGFFSGEYSVKPGNTIGSFDTFRQSLYRFMFLAGGFLPDARWGYVVSYILSVLLGFWALYALLRKLSVKQDTALLTSTVALFCYQGVAHLFYLDIGRAGNAVIHLLNFNGKLWHENLNSNFRYTVMSAIPFFVWGLMWLENSLTKPRAMRIAIMGVAVWIIQYVYVPVSLYLDVFMVALLAYDLRQKNKVRVGDALLTGTVAVGLFLLLGGIKHVQNFLNYFPPVIAESHLQGSGASLKTSLFILTSALIPWFLFRRLKGLPENLTRYLQANLWTYAFLSLVMLITLRHEMFVRFFERGFGLMWATTVLLLVFLNWESKHLRWIPAVLSAIFLLGSGLSASHLSRQSLLRLEEDRWKSYEYLREHFPEDTKVFTTSYVDMQLLGSYTAMDLTVAGAEYLEVPHESLQAYLSGMFATTSDTCFLRNWVLNYFEDEKKFTCTPRKKVQVSEGLETLKQLLYDPYIKTFDGVPVREGEKFSPQFLKKLVLIEGNARNTGREFLKKEAEAVLVAPPFHSQGIEGFKKVFESGKFQIFRRLTP